MRFKKLAARATIVAYLGVFVFSDYHLARLRAAEQTPIAPGEVAALFGVNGGSAKKGDAEQPPSLAGQPDVLAPNSALSAAVITTVGGGPFGAVSLLADWDGREDLTADRARNVDDQLANPPANANAVLTRAAISEHTVANGFNENVYYYGDSAGNLTVAVDAGGDGTINARQTVNLPTTLNAFGTLQSASQVAITGLCVSPVADLTSYFTVNGGYSFYNGRVGEVLIVTYNDFGGGLRLSGSGEIVRSGLLAFPLADVVSPAPAPPGILTPAGFPVTFGGSFGVTFSTFANVAGCAVDDDGSVYFQQVDLQQFTGANIVKLTRIGTNQDRSVATSGFSVLNTLNPASGVYPLASGPPEQVNRFTNFSGTTTTWGNITALATGPHNALYAAVAQSAVPGSASAGLFDNDPALGPTPSMIISFADTIGTFLPSPEVALPDGFADAAGPGPATPGVNNFRVFAHGAGPDRRGSNIPVFGTTTDTLKVDFQVDYTIYAGLTVNEAREVFLVSGGTPAAVGRNPSPTFGEIQVFTDTTPADRRADFVDLRGDTLPNPPGSGGNAGDGDSDRFDHVWSQAPLDAVSLTPTGLAGLSRGFLRYTNRLAPNAISPGVTLGQTVAVQADDVTDGPIFFGGLDPGNQAGGGDDLRFPTRGDDAATGGFPPVAVPASGGFEFGFGATVGACTSPWNAFFLNSNGNITFNAGDTTFQPTANLMLTGPPRIAPAWRDLNMAIRSPARLSAFPVQALGFAGVNQFEIRWINAHRFDTGVGQPSRNNFSVSLFDDGTAQDENAAAGTQEGPTDSRHLSGPTGVVATPLRAEGSAPFTFEYAWMDGPAVFGAPAPGQSALVGYSIGQQPAGSVAEGNVSELGRSALIGAGRAVETAIFELFDAGDFDLRAEGNDAAASTPAGQPNANREVLDFFGRSCAAPALRLTTAVTGSGSVSGTGIACPGDCEEVFPSGTLVTLTATPAAGFSFSNWLGCDVPSGATCTVNMNAFKFVTAQFVAAPPPPQPLQGTLNQSAYSTGQVLTLTLTLDPAVAGPGPVDAYVVFDLPGGLGSYSLQLPIGANVLVPGQVKIAGPFVPFAFSAVVLSAPLAGIPAGAYQLRTFLTQAGTMNVIGSVDVTPFTFTP